jgi:hypothetical protein
MSTIKANAWRNLNGVLYNSVVQVQTQIVNTTNAYASPVNSQTIIDPLSITITPIYASSKIIVDWMVNGELHQDNLFRIFRNGVEAPNGRNTSVAANRFVGYTCGFYDQNEDSTPSNWKITYFDNPGVNTPVTYQLAIGSSTGVAYTFALNRCINATFAEPYERMVSTVMIWEIQQ